MLSRWIKTGALLALVVISGGAVWVATQFRTRHSDHHSARIDRTPPIRDCGRLGTSAYELARKVVTNELKFQDEDHGHWMCRLENVLIQLFMPPFSSEMNRKNRS